MCRAALLLVVAASLGLGALKTYEVVPCSNYIAVKAQGDEPVTQYFRNTVDSLCVVSLWVGDAVDLDSIFRIVVRDSATNELIAQTRAEGVRPAGNWHWMPCTLVTSSGKQPVRGRTYRITATRPSGLPIEFAYSPHNPYHFGDAVVTGCTPELPDSADVALRVYGVMRPVRAEDWGFNVGFPREWPDEPCTSAVRPRADSAGVAADRFWFGADWMARGRDTYQFPDAEFDWSHGQLGCEETGLLVACPWWASTRVLGITWVEDRPETLWSGLCPPRGLFDSVGSPSNYWAEFVRFVVAGAGDRIHTWEAYNEANVIDRFWQRPNTGWYEDYTSDSGMCELYTRLCVVTDSAVRLVSGHANDRVLVGSMSEVENAGTDPYRVRGKDWLRMMYHFAGSFRWDGVTVHPYQPAGLPFDQALFLRNADTIRAVMREHGDYGPLWITELGWNTRPYGRQQNYVSEEQQAVNFCQTYTAALASAASPSAGYDRVYWFSFVDIGGENAEHFSLLDTMPDCLPKRAVWASGQTRDMLAGKRFNGRVVSGDPEVDAVLSVYEFEDSSSERKTWVAWRTAGGGAPSTFRIPARVDEPDTVSLAYLGTEAPYPINADVNGWLSVGLTERPKFIQEPIADSSRPLHRPDLLVDSIGLSPDQPRTADQVLVGLRVINQGTAATPAGCSVVVHLRWNGTTVDSFRATTQIDTGDTVVLNRNFTVPSSMHGDGLLTAVVNPGMRFVELTGTDDNSAYLRRRIRYRPVGIIDEVLPGGRSCVPRVLLNLSSISFENDSAACESLQMLQAHYGVSDTVPDTIIASAWFKATPCTTWQFLAGEGHYRFACLASDSGGNISDTAWHDTTFITFDSTPPTVSVVVNSGDAFTNDPSVLVSWAGADSLSPPCSVRLGNAELVNVVAGSGLGTGDTFWRFSEGQTDGASGMARLVLGSGEAWTWTVVPGSSVSPLLGKTVRLSADLLQVTTDTLGGTAGRLEFGYLYECTLPESTDTMQMMVDQVDIPLGTAALIGPDRVEKRFTCPTPQTVANYEWVAGYVRCHVDGLPGVGTLWLDNFRLDRIGPDEDCSGWLPPDSVQTWNLSAGDGRRTVWLAVQDVSGNETRVETCDSINLDITPPVATISEPIEGSKVNGEFMLLGAAYDPLAGQGQDWFESYRLEYSRDGEEWLPVDPQTEFFEPAVPYWDSTSIPVWYPAELGYWNTEGLEDGEYYVRLTVTDSAGNQSADVTWYVLANQSGDSEYDAAGPDGGGSGLGEGSILVGSATGVLRVYDEDLNILSTRTVTDSGTAAYITAAVRHSPDTLILLNARAHTLLALGSTGEPVRLARGLGLPTGLAKDASGAYWLTDKLTGRLARYKRGEGLELITDSLSGPEAVGTRGDRVYVADTRNNRIAVYDTSGAELPSITGGFTGPQAIALPEQGGIYLTEPQTGTIKGITSDGTVYYTLGNTTVHKGLLSSPDGTKLYTLKPAGNRVLSYRIRSSDSLPGGGQAAGERNLPRTLTLNAPRPNPSNRATQLSYGLPRASRVSIRLYDAAGRQCANLVDCQQKAGWYHLTWDGRGNSRALPAGVYFIQLTTDSGRTQKKLVRTE